MAPPRHIDRATFSSVLSCFFIAFIVRNRVGEAADNAAEICATRTLLIAKIQQMVGIKKQMTYFFIFCASGRNLYTASVRIAHAMSAWGGAVLLGSSRPWSAVSFRCGAGNTDGANCIRALSPPTRSSGGGGRRRPRKTVPAPLRVCGWRSGLWLPRPAPRRAAAAASPEWRDNSGACGVS